MRRSFVPRWFPMWVGMLVGPVLASEFGIGTAHRGVAVVVLAFGISIVWLHILWREHVERYG